MLKLSLESQAIIGNSRYHRMKAMDKSATKHQLIRARKTYLKKLKAIRDEQKYRATSFCQYR